jgi:outer membrane protein OmpA-like peptidoglycan-associated protein
MRKSLSASFVMTVLCLAGGVACAGQARLATPGNPAIQNGDFEDVKIAAPFASTNPADVPGWTHTGGGEGYLWRVGYSDGGGSITRAGSGSQFVTLGGGYGGPGSATWSTKISHLTAGKTYQLSFMLANENLDGPQSVTVAFASGSSTPAQSYIVYPGKGYWSLWEEEGLVFKATAATAELKFSVTNQQYDIGLDNVRVGPPSPQFSVKKEAGKIGITLNAALLFDFDRYALKPAAETVLAEIKSKIIDQHPHGKVMVEGYTDNVGTDAYNLQLSNQRAQAVADWLQKHGLEASRIETKGYGKERPRVPNTSDDNRAKNRRVQINVIEP